MEENIYSTSPSAVTTFPDSEERRQIRKKYNRAAFVILLNLFLFNGIAIVAEYAAFAFAGGGFSAEALRAGRDIIVKNDIIATLLSCLPPIISETSSIILGIKFFGINLKGLVSNKDGYSGGTVIKLVTLCLGLQLAASIIAAILQQILNGIGFKAQSPDISATTSFGANVILSFYACILGPILEELLYRGVLLQSMRKYNERMAIFLSAAIFGLMHQNYQQCILAFVVGIPLAIIAVKYDSLIPTIFAHIFMNTTGLLSTYLLQYFAPEIYSAALSGDTDIDLGSLTGAALAVLMAIVLFRMVCLVAGLIVGIIALSKGGNMKRPTPAGKTRGFPILARSVLWWIVFLIYFFIIFVKPFFN